MSKNKSIKHDPKIVISDQKTPKTKSDPEGYFSKSPSWCFSKCDTGYEKWSVSESNFVKDILPHLISLERRKWSEILNDKKNNHWISIGDLSKEAQDRALCLPQIIDDELLSLRLTGKYRLFGFIENGVFFILWADPKHEVCISNKKHT